MEYKGYKAVICFSGDDRCFYGKVLCTKDFIGFDGTTVSELEDSFHSALDDYLDLCREENKEPAIPISGDFESKISPEQLAHEFIKHDMKLNPEEIDHILRLSNYNLLDEHDDSRERFWTHWKGLQRMKAVDRKVDLKKAV
jgi:predicted HicB family RNase H-like nuclease